MINLRSASHGVSMLFWLAMVQLVIGFWPQELPDWVRSLRGVTPVSTLESGLLLIML